MIANDRVCQRPLTGRTVLICLIAFFAVVAIVNGIMIRAAISTFGGVETGSAYQAGPGIQARHRSRARAAGPTLAGEGECAAGPTAGPWSRSTRATGPAIHSQDLRPSRRYIGRPTGAAISSLR